MGAVVNYLENCVHTKVNIEALERLMEPEEVEVCLRYILKYSPREGREKRTTSWRAENDVGESRERRQHSRKLAKLVA